jgi:hypothetical protein
MGDNDDVLLEDIIMKFLYTDSKIRDKVIPYFKFSIFDNSDNVDLLKFIKKIITKYGKFPNVKETRLKIKDADVFNHLREVLKIDISDYTTEVILGEIERYVQQKSLMEVCFSIAEKVTNEKMDEVLNAPDEIREALAFSFDDNVGLDIFDESSEHVFNKRIEIVRQKYLDNKIVQEIIEFLQRDATRSFCAYDKEK